MKLTYRTGMIWEQVMDGRVLTRYSGTARESHPFVKVPWTSAKNYNFGFIGKKESGYRSGRPDGEWIRP